MNSSDSSILTYAQYGNILVPSKDLALARGSGNWSPLPRWEQSTDRGNVYENEYPMYNNGVSIKKGKNQPAPIDVDNLSSTYSTPNNLIDQMKKRVYSVGSTGMHPEETDSWKNPEYEGAQNKYIEWALKALTPGGITATPFIIYFFSTENVEYLQQRTKDEIKKHTGMTINDQSTDELLIIMRNKIIYAYSGWLPNEDSQGGPSAITNRGEKPCSLENRLIKLNKSVIEETVKQVISGINMYKQYYKDQSSMPMPMDRSLLTTMKGSRELYMSNGFNSGLEQTISQQSYSQRYNII